MRDFNNHKSGVVESGNKNIEMTLAEYLYVVSNTTDFKQTDKFAIRNYS